MLYLLALVLWFLPSMSRADGLPPCSKGAILISKSGQVLGPAMVVSPYTIITKPCSGGAYMDVAFVVIAGDVSPVRPGVPMAYRDPPKPKKSVGTKVKVSKRFKRKHRTFRA